MFYRPDIDGLRAVSIILVLLFHIDLWGVTGGFIGVDVFFVISGYLISKIILTHLNRGDFSLINFYERRIRRIFPALIAMLLVSAVFAWVLLMPKEFQVFGGNLSATTAFVSNILFWRESGYFDLSGHFKPLLHTWSIALEEQFYIFFPLCLIFIFKWCRFYLTPLIILGLIMSFGLSVWVLSIGKDIAAFYLLPTRAWELLAGALLAVCYQTYINKRSAPFGTVWLNVLSIFGLVLIVAAAFNYSKETVFPGIAALAPVLGACLIIWSGSFSPSLWLSRVLSIPPIVFIGKISYSLYLWHWPVFIYFEYYLIRDLTLFEKLMSITFCVCLATLSWKFIEEPFRLKGKVYRQKRVFLWAAALMFSLFVVGFYIYVNQGLPNRLSKEVLMLSQAEKGLGTEVYGLADFHWSNRLVGDETAGRFSYLIWGDSHANALAPALSEASKVFKKKGLLLKNPGCLSAIDLKAEDLNEECMKFNQAVREKIDTLNIKKVFLIGRWSAYPKWFSDEGEKYGTKSSREKFKTLVESTVQDLVKNGIEVFLLAEVPKISVDQVPSVLARAKRTGRNINLEVTPDEYQEQQDHIFLILEQIARDNRVTLIYPHEALCDDKRCALEENGRSLYFDDDHLSKYGAEGISAHFSEYFK